MKKTIAQLKEKVSKTGPESLTASELEDLKKIQRLSRGDRTMEKKDWIKGDLIEWRCEEGWEERKPARVLISVIEILCGCVYGEIVEVENWSVGDRWNSPLEPTNGSFTFVRRPAAKREEITPQQNTMRVLEGDGYTDQDFAAATICVGRAADAIKKIAQHSRADANECIDLQIETLQSLKRSLQPKARWQPKPEPRTPVVGRFI